MAGWHEPLDLYCERLDAGLWAEPLNALSNVAFLVAALATGLLARQRGSRSGMMLATLIALIGIGSGLFHTVATRWAALADVVPIFAFILVYFYLALTRFLDLRAVSAISLVALLVGMMLVLQQAATGAARGAASYLPALIALVATAALLRYRATLIAIRERDGVADDESVTRFLRHAATARSLSQAAAVFALSLVLRTADLPFCNRFPLGLHFLWHLLNAAVLYILAAAAIRHRAPDVWIEGDDEP